MWRALIFIVLLAIAAFGAVWLADRPGSVIVTFAGYELRTTVAVGATVLAGVALALALLWSVVSGLLGLPSRLTFASRARRRAQGFQAISRGMIAVGAGDAVAARRYAGEADRLVGREPLALLLKAQAAQVSGNRAGAEAAFTRMVDDPETRVLGLRGLYVEARRRGDAEAARQYAQEAARLAPAASWASDAMLEARSAERDWRGAIASLERRQSLGLLDKAAFRRQRAVLLTADALDRAERDPAGALTAASAALKDAPDLVPAATLAGKLLSHRGDLRRAARTVEAAWQRQPHPDLAAVYLNLRPGDSALDRLRRAETLAKLSSWEPEARLALARAAMEAREFPRARATLAPLAADRPTVRVCLLMADLEQAEHGGAGRAREWLARAARAPRDPAWIADGVVAEQWAPVSPVTGRVDAFVWQAPPDVLTGPETPIDEVTGDLDEPIKMLEAEPVKPPAAALAQPVQAPSPRAPSPPIEPAFAPVRAAVAEASSLGSPGAVRDAELAGASPALPPVAVDAKFRPNGAATSETTEIATVPSLPPEEEEPLTETGRPRGRYFG